jgi:transcription elongation factor GreB
VSDPITPAGMASLRARYDQLFLTERPQMVETVSWAAGNGDRSENGDYIYGRKRLAQIDRELAHLARRMKELTIVDPAAQPDKTRIFFGATVRIVDEDDREQTLTLVGRDEADATAGRIAWNSPVAIALRGAAAGHTRTVRLPAGQRTLEVLEITYPEWNASSRT